MFFHVFLYSLKAEFNKGLTSKANMSLNILIKFIILKRFYTLNMMRNLMQGLSSVQQQILLFCPIELLAYAK